MLTLDDPQFALASLQGNPARTFFIEGFDSEIECPNCGFLIDASHSNLTMMEGSDEAEDKN